jgi:alpha/beta superfamily hydrolase
VRHQLVPGANHYFHNRIEALGEAVDDYLVAALQSKLAHVAE